MREKERERNRETNIKYNKKVILDYSKMHAKKLL